MNYTAPFCLGDQALIKRNADGRFAIYKTEGRERGARGAAPLSMYSVFDCVMGVTTKVRSLKDVDCLIHYRLTTEQTAPWFIGATAAAPKATLVAA